MSSITRVMVALMAVSSMAAAQFSEDFDAGFPSNWNTQSAATTWTWNVGPTGSSGTGPSGDHTTGSGAYIYLEATGQATGADAIVDGPIIDGSGGGLMVSFWYHMSGAGMGTLELFEYDGANWNMVWSLTGDQGTSWLLAAVPINTYGANNRAQFRFRAVRGSSFQSDICIDDVSVNAPLLPLYQVNQANAGFDINGAVGDDQNVANTTVYNSCPNLCLNLSSTLTGSGWDLGYAPGEPPTSLGGAFVTGEGQIVNMDISALGTGVPTFLNGGVLPALAGTSFANNTLCLPYTQAPGTVLHGQMVIADPTRPDGISLSAAARVEWAADTIPASPTMPGDDSFVEIDLGCLGAMDFCATPYSSFFINSNGTVGFGNGDQSWNSSPAAGASGTAKVGFWSDLSPQLAGASVNVSETGGVIRVDFVNVPYYSPNTITVTYHVDLDTNNGNITIGGLSGISANPAAGGGGDSQWLGLSKGASADPGQTAFGTGLTGGPGTVLYEYTDGLTAPVLPPSVAAGMTSLTFTPDGAGGYLWIGL